MFASVELGGKSVQRGQAFLIEEDKNLCNAWLEISQDPIRGTNQKKEKLWERISAKYHELLPSYNSGSRTTKSLQCCMALIMKAINKFQGCVRSVERLNPSGASEIDYMDQAKILFAQDPEERKGFQYYHVWPILKEAEKWLDNTPKENPKQGYDCFEGFQNGSLVSASLVAPSSIDLDANEETVSEVDHHVDSSGRPIGRKKEKLRRMQIADKSHLLESIVEGNQEIMINLKRGQKQREERFAKMENDSAARVQLMMLQAENESKRLKLQREHQEKQIMKMDLKSIADPIDREYFRRKKLEILEQNDQVANNSVSFSHGDFSSFRQYEGGDVLPDY
ncbi:glutathione S-transferase T3-like [Camellia sinensis]|uniref:glutathione S-transferase T3-like n=1 Tax=Camellia sinensis TaxID=4442 RepID=UPI0010365AF3|nr:glutathione S-transferase T3-like [Camellia sinensis]